MAGKAWVWKKAEGKYLVRRRGEPILGTYATREEAEQARDNANVLHPTGPHPFGPLWEEPKPTPRPAPRNPLAGYLRDWVTTDRSIRETTRKTYTGHVRNHIDGTDLGRKAIADITPRDIDRYWAGLDVGDGTRHVLWELLSKAFRRAARLEDVPPGLTAFERIGIPKPQLKPRRYRGKIDRAGLERLADAAESTRDRLAILVMGYCGLRPSEVAGLRVTDFDPAECEITVAEQVLRAAGANRYGPTKESDVRTVGVPESLCVELTAFLEGVTTERMFVGARGGPWAKVNRAVRKAAERADLDVHAHLLRHLAGSLAFEDGATAAEVAELLGDSLAQVQATYIEASKTARRRIAEASERRRAAHRNGA